MIEGLRLSEALRTSPWAMLKLLEIKALRRFASVHCYNYPWAVQIEVTNNCNLMCKTCPRLDELKRKGGSIRDMDFETYKTILGRLTGLFWLFLCGRGEPLLNKDIYRMVAYAADRGIPGVIVSTNGTLLRGENVQRLIEARPRAVGVSIDSPDQETLRRIRNVDLEKVLENIKNFTSRSEIPVGITAVLNRENLHNIFDMPSLCHGVGAKYLRILSMVEYDSDSVRSIRLEDFDSRRYALLRKELRTRCRMLGVDLIMQKRLRDDLCLTPFNFANIDVEGNLTVCCTLPEVTVGNVLKEDFLSVWNSKRMMQWRKMLLTGNYPKPCRDIRCFRISPMG